MLLLFSEMSGDEDSNLYGQQGGILDSSTLSVGGESGYDDAISEINDNLNESNDHEFGNSNEKDEDDSFKIVDDDKGNDGRDSAFADDMSLLSLQTSTR